MQERHLGNYFKSFWKLRRFYAASIYVDRYIGDSYDKSYQCDKKNT